MTLNASKKQEICSQNGRSDSERNRRIKLHTKVHWNRVPQKKQHPMITQKQRLCELYKLPQDMDTNRCVIQARDWTLMCLRYCRYEKFDFLERYIHTMDE